MVIGWILRFWLVKNTHIVWLDALNWPVNNPVNIFFNKPKYYFILFLIIKYWSILRMPSFLIEQWSAEKSCIVLFKEISLWSYFVLSFDTLPKKILPTYVILCFKFVNLCLFAHK